MSATELTGWSAHRKGGIADADSMARYHEWLRSRPPQIQAAAARWPANTYFKTPEGILHVVGYAETEDDHGCGEAMLILSRADPAGNYEAVYAKEENLIRVCLHHLKDIEIQ